MIKITNIYRTPVRILENTLAKGETIEVTPTYYSTFKDFIDRNVELGMITLDNVPETVIPETVIPETVIPPRKAKDKAQSME